VSFLSADHHLPVAGAGIKWVAAVLSGRATLPGEKDMMAAVREHYLQMEEAGRPKRHTHVIMPKWVSEPYNVSH